MVLKSKFNIKKKKRTNKIVKRIKPVKPSKGVVKPKKVTKSKPANKKGKSTFKIKKRSSAKSIDIQGKPINISLGNIFYYFVFVLWIAVFAFMWTIILKHKTNSIKIVSITEPSYDDYNPNKPLRSVESEEIRIINGEANGKRYYTQKNFNFKNTSEIEGIQRLRKIVSKSPFELSLLYIPAEKRWVNISDYSEFKTNSGECHYASVSSDSKKLYYYLKKYNNIVKYHLHPISMPSNLPIISKKRKSNKADVAEIIYSKQDILAHIHSSELFYANHPNGNFRSGIISYWGVTSYALTKKGRDMLHGESASYKSENAEIISSGFVTYVVNKLVGSIGIQKTHWKPILYKPHVMDLYFIPHKKVDSISKDLGSFIREENWEIN